jgi:hypothetical protein
MSTRSTAPCAVCIYWILKIWYGSRHLIPILPEGVGLVRLQPQALPLTESGQLNIMSNYKTFSFTVVGIVTTMAIVCHFGVQALDKATAQQCKTHAWPQAAHQIHMDWCADNGYATN